MIFTKFSLDNEEMSNICKEIGLELVKNAYNDCFSPTNTKHFSENSGIVQLYVEKKKLVLNFQTYI